MRPPNSRVRPDRPVFGYSMWLREENCGLRAKNANFGSGALEGSGTLEGRRLARGSARGPPYYQAVAVETSLIPSDSSQRSASIAALQPSAAAVTAWR
jgi:hypothetical protein